MPLQDTSNTALESGAGQITQTTQKYFQIYSINPEIKRTITSRVWQALATLIEIDRFLQVVERGDLEQALLVIEATSLLPLHGGGDIGLVSRMSDEFGMLDSSIAQNIPDLLVQVMEILRSLAKKYRETTPNLGTTQLTVLRPSIIQAN